MWGDGECGLAAARAAKPAAARRAQDPYGPLHPLHSPPRPLPLSAPAHSNSTTAQQHSTCSALLHLHRGPNRMAARRQRCPCRSSRRAASPRRCTHRPSRAQALLRQHTHISQPTQCESQSPRANPAADFSSSDDPFAARPMPARQRAAQPPCPPPPSRPRAVEREGAISLSLSLSLSQAS